MNRKRLNIHLNSKRWLTGSMIRSIVDINRYDMLEDRFSSKDKMEDKDHQGGY